MVRGLHNKFCYQFVRALFFPVGLVGLCCVVCVADGCGCVQVFFDLMREIRSRKSDDTRATNGDVKKKRRKIKCAIL